MTRWNILIDLINTNGYKKIAEIGVRRGRTARKVLVACELDRYVLVDPVWFPVVSRLVTQYPIAQYRIETSKLAASFIKDDALDLVFLDALHDYEHVLEDINLWLPKIREGGILCGDDYDSHKCPGVKEAVGEAFGDKVELIDVGVKGVKVWLVRI